MKVTLKNISFSERMSEETNSFVADVYVDGKKVGYAKNDGHGGSTYYAPYFTPDARAIMEKAEDWLKSQPQINIGSENDPYMVNCDMESMVDKLFEDWLKEKNDKKMKKDFIKGIVINTNSGYSTIYWKGYTIPMLMETEKGRKVLKTELDKLRGEGKVILNDNLGDL